MNHHEARHSSAGGEGSAEGDPTERPPTELVNPRTTDIDRLDTPDLLRRLNSEDHSVPEAVGGALPQLAHAVDLAVDALRAGGRVHYVGAGTSGRLAVLDAAELVPTYNVPPEWFVVHLAGGDSAVWSSVENAEDDAAAGADSVERTATGADIVIGLAASGKTPYVLGALEAAHGLGASTVLVSSNPNRARGPAVDVAVTVDTGAEPVTGSTRMKAGTAQKLVLTSFSTAVMVRLGRTYSNLMVSMVATNAKLRTRTVRILGEATGATWPECESALHEADGDLKTALVHMLGGVDVAGAAAALGRSDGHVREALRALGP
ncbi:N-acetylmuramic acid 6-phosphate etherase [Actinopolyspora halophila]|uniref:N-acetylmuramic acid 6-phosphate etherase n=1 Tax=Actinopolyspora halophila TaxID=1850 RepID=UPI000361196E|nr:N-acetylmuramic acid 6-phosphate etherase [Actinopolyspora halophila]